MTAPPPNSVANERIGWIMVAFASVISGMGFGALLSVTVFLEPLELEFGWLRNQTSFAYMAANITAGFGGIMAGYLSDRFSTAPVILLGSIWLGISFILLGLMRNLAEFYLVYGVVLGLLGISSFLVPLITSIGFWFNKNRGLAISVTMAGQTAGAAIVPYFSTLFIETWGWRHAYILLGLVTWLLLIPLCFLWRDPKGLQELKVATRANTKAGRDAPTAIGSLPLVIVLSIAILGCCVCMTVPLVHLVPLARGYAYTPQQSAFVLSVLVFASVAGRLFFGLVMDRIGGVRTLFITSGLQTISIFWLTQFDTLPMLYLFAAVFGFGYGGVLPSYPVIIAGLVPPHLTGRSSGIVFFAGYVAMGLGGYAGGLLFDLTGNYVMTYGMGAAGGVFNLIIVAMLHLRISRKQALLDAAQLQPEAA